MHYLNNIMLKTLRIFCFLQSFFYLAYAKNFAMEMPKKSRHFKVAALPVIPFVNWNLEANPPELIGGADLKLLNLFAEKLDFSYEIHLPPEQSYGVKTKDGVWKGMIGMMANNKTDFGIPHCFITPGRMTVIDYTSPYVFYTLIFAVRAPTQLSKLTAIIRPFSRDLWIGVFVCMIVLAPMLFVIILIDSRMNNYRRWTIGNTYWITFTAFIGQALSNNVKKIEVSKPVNALWFAMVLILLASYSGMVISFLTIPGYNSVIGTFQELEEAIVSGDYECGSFKDSAAETPFFNAKRGMLRTLGDVMVRPENRCPSTEAGLKQVLKRKFAYILGSVTLRFEVLKAGSEKFHMAEQGMFSFPAALTLHKSFPLKKEFKKLISRVFEAGITNKFFEEEAETLRRQRNAGTEEEDEEGYQPLSVNDLSSAFILLFTGYAAGFICLIVEKVVNGSKTRPIM